MIEKISGITKKLAESIAQAALRLNGGKTPQAVIVVGGGSRTFNLIPELARGFNLAAEKIGIRLPSAIKTIKNITPDLSGPEAVTPLGIAVMTAESSGLNFIEVEVNNKKFKMLDFQQKKDIVGALT
ncbi:MAG TPA: cell division protein, partial [Candidatus Omnitrophica bacterium]|nr:cell division protein [Candidatus Omnitrophota bacterium]